MTAVSTSSALAGRPWARYVGAVPHAQMRSLLSQADVVLNCSASEGGMANSVLEAFARQTRLHQLGRRRAEDEFPVCRHVVRMGVADKDPLRPESRLVRIQPQTELWQAHTTVVILELQDRHKKT